MKIIDAHIHIWQSGSPRKAHRQTPYSALDVLKDMDLAGISAAIIHPPAWDSNANLIAIDAARQHPTRFGILGNFPLDDPNRLTILKNWKEQPQMLGLRFILNEPIHLTWMSGYELDWLWSIAQDANIPIALAASSHLQVFALIAKRFPELKLIIDHLGVPVDAKGHKAFLQMPILQELAIFPNIAIKATAVPAYATDPYPYKSIETNVQLIYQAFGAERFFWGSDITKLDCSWSECIDLFLNDYTWIGQEEKKLVMGQALANWLDWSI
jgi:predicted TIM-barrel fold metal-dependent hydrolase